MPLNIESVVPTFFNDVQAETPIGGYYFLNMYIGLLDLIRAIVDALNGLNNKEITMPKHLLPYFTEEKVNDPLPIKVLKELKDIGVDIPEILINDNLYFSPVVNNEISSYNVNTYDIYAENKTLFSCNNSIMVTEPVPDEDALSLE